LDLATLQHPAGGRSTPSGDVHECVEVDGSVVLLIADARGAGARAARLASPLVDAFGPSARRRRSLEGIAADLDDSLRRELGPEDFVTALLARCDAAGTLEVLNLGHPAPLLIRGDHVGRIRPPSRSVPLGLDPAARSTSTRLAPGDRLLFHTDGLTEARRPDGTFVDIPSLVPMLRAARLVDGMTGCLAVVDDQTGGAVDDDLTVVLGEFRPDWAP
jgi:serine phosphatase RsbU (regulator of sigma subunit)